MLAAVAGLISAATARPGAATTPATRKKVIRRIAYDIEFLLFSKEMRCNIRIWKCARAGLFILGPVGIGPYSLVFRVCRARRPETTLPLCLSRWNFALIVINFVPTGRPRITYARIKLGPNIQ
jgi:hypothetical protein